MDLRDGFTTNNLGVRAEGFLLTYNMPISSLLRVPMLLTGALSTSDNLTVHLVRLRTLANKPTTQCARVRPKVLNKITTFAQTQNILFSVILLLWSADLLI